MGFVLLSIFCSVTVSVILKLARRYGVDASQIIVWNYPITVLCTWIFLRPELSRAVFEPFPLSVCLALALLLPGIFLLLSASIRYTGIVRTEVAQRLSLFISLVAAFWLFDERAGVGQLVGIGVGFVAILCSIGWHRGRGQTALSYQLWLYPLLVFVGYGVVDILLKTIAQYTAIPYAVSLFVVFSLAMLVAFIYLLSVLVSGYSRFDFRAMWWGFALGAFNFGNFLFYMKAHRALPDNPSTVFTAMNVGVIALGTLVGVVMFHEKLSLINKVGIILAIIAVFIIAYL